MTAPTRPPHVRHTLPERPWLRRDVPLMWRSDTLLQIGLDPQRLVVIEVDRALITWARELGGDRTLTAVLTDAEQRGLDTAEVNQLLRALTAAGALADAAKVAACAQQLTADERITALRHEAAARHTYRDTRAQLSVDARANARISIAGSGFLADTVANALRDSGIKAVVAEAAPSSAARQGRARAEQSDLHIVADCWQPDIFDDLTCGGLDLAHLAVGAWGRRGVVGPLVIPGHTSCLRCVTLHQRDHDPLWPRLAMQAAHATPDIDARDSPLVMACAAHTAALACAYLEARAWGTTGTEWAGTSQVITMPGARVSFRQHPVHPLCGCTWNSTSV
ncbi:MAG: TOMM precursor leader peptide-binding protein [Candidatus Nanopelagicales bacterium]